MLVWINGTFGVGKSSVAAALRARLSGARIFDPEWIGLALQRPRPTRRADFQDFPAWRRWTRRVAWICARAFRGPTIVPMTLVNAAYFEEILGGLRRAGVDVRHFTLTASPATIRRRLHRRAADPSWAEARVEPNVAALEAPRFGRHVSTESSTPGEVADLIVAALSRE